MRDVQRLTVLATEDLAAGKALLDRGVVKPRNLQ